MVFTWIITATRRFTGLALMVRTLSFLDYHVLFYTVALVEVVPVLNSDVSCVLFSFRSRHVCRHITRGASRTFVCLLCVCFNSLQIKSVSTHVAKSHPNLFKVKREFV